MQASRSMVARTGRRLVLAPLAFALAAGLAQAQDRAPGGTPASGGGPNAAQQAQPARTDNYRALRASELIGRDVRGAKGEDVGEIKDLVIDLRSARVRYAVLEFDPGILQAEKLVPVPLDRLRMGRDRDELVYNVNREQLERAAVDRRDMHDNLLSDNTRMGIIDRAWGPDLGAPHTPKTRGQAQAQEQHLRLASTLLGKPVQGRAGQSVGELEELVVDMAGRRVHYAVVALDAAWAGTDKRVVLPVTALNPGRNREALVLHADKARLQAMPAFDEKRYANLNDASLRGDVARWLAQARSGNASADSGGGSDTRSSGAPGQSPRDAASGK